MAITKIQSESLNLADTYAFTGTVTGTPGITQADVWRIIDGAGVATSNTRTVITGTWERADDSAVGYVGSGMSQSSGVFTFPQTGFYLVEFIAQYYASADRRYVAAIIEATTNNSDYDRLAFGRSHIEHSYGTTYAQPTTSTIIDVTDTSNVKVRFLSQSEDSATLNTATDENYTYAVFIRLGDT